MIKTETKAAKKRKDREAAIIELWNSYYKKGETQKTPLAESIAKKKGVSLSTVKRIVKGMLMIAVACALFSCKTQSINPARYEITYSNGVSRVVNNWHFRTDAIRGGSVHVVKVAPCPEN